MQNPLSILADPVCRRIWLAGVAINIMRWLGFLAYSLYALAETSSPLWVALTGFARLLPLLFGGILSAWIEGLDRRRVMAFVMLLLTLIDGLMLVLTLLGLISVGWLLVASALAGIAWSFENSLRRTMLADAAGLSRMSESMGLEAASNQATRMLGPALGGALIASIGLVGVFTLGVILHALGLFAFANLPGSLAGRSGKKRLAILAMFKDGLAYIRHHKVLQGSLAITFIVNMWGFPYVTLAPVIAERVYKLEPFSIGLLLATEALGGLIGSMLVMFFARPKAYVLLYAIGALVFIAMVMTMGLFATPWPAYATLLLAGLGMAGFNSMQITIPLMATPADLKVRVMGLITVCIGASPIGILHAGFLAEMFGAQTAQLIIGCEGLLAMAFTFWRWPELLRARAPAPA